MKKFFAALLAMIMVLSLVPATIFAAEAVCPGANETHNKDNCTNYHVVEEKEPECGEWSYNIYKCDDCGAQFADDFVKNTATHTWGEWKVTKEATCTKAGEKVAECSICGAEKTEAIEALGHKYESTEDKIGCAATQKCTVCGEEKEGDEHTWGAKPSQIVEEPYFDADGIAHDGTAEYLCTACGTAKYVPIICEHEHDYELVIEAEEADCLNDGTIDVYQCKICKKYYKLVKSNGSTGADGDVAPDYYVEITLGKTVDELGNVIPATGHDFTGEGVRGTNSCIEVKTCLNGCGATMATEGDEIVHVDRKLILKAEATCTKYGFELWGCTNCGMTEIENLTAPLGHKETTVTVPGTCTYPGYTFTYCANANCPTYELVSEVTESAEDEELYRIDSEYAHLFGGYDVTVDDEAVALISIADTDIIADYHKLVADVDDLDGDEDVKELVPGNTEYVLVQAPTCYTSGVGVWHCVLCGFHKEQVAQAGHNFELDEEQSEPATCEEPGVNVYVCSGCGLTKTEETEIADHDFELDSTFVSCIPMDVEDNGVYVVSGEFYRCSMCGAYKYDNLVLAENFEMPSYFESLEDALKVHGYIVTYEDGTAPDISNDCEKIAEGEEGYVYNAPTCTEVGYESYICNDCGHKFLVEIPMLGHVSTEENVIAGTPADCHNDGVKDHFICDNCDALYIYNDKQEQVVVTEADLVIPAAHGKIETIKAFDSACEEDEPVQPEVETAYAVIKALLDAGYGLSRDVKYCTVCGDAWDGSALLSAAPKTLLKSDLFIAPGHNWVDVAGKEATCQYDGLEAGKYCTKCHETDNLADLVLNKDGSFTVTQYVIPAFNHTFNPELHDGNEGSSIIELDHNDPLHGCKRTDCYEDCAMYQYWHHICVLCEKEWIDGWVSAAEGHTNEAGELIPETCCPDEDADRHCVICDQDIEAKDHAIVEVEVPATCVADGYTLYYCKNCEYREVIESDIDLMDPDKHPEDAIVEDAENGIAYCELCGKVLGKGLAIIPTTSVEKLSDGVTFTVEVVINATELDVWGLKFDLCYEADVLELIDAKIASENFTYAGQINDSIVVDEDDYSTGVISVALNAEDDVVVDGEQLVLEVTFKVSNTTEWDETYIWVEVENDEDDPNAINKDGDVIYCIDFVLELELDLFLDVDGDGIAATMLDALAMYELIVANEYYAPADTDGDGVITMVDLLNLYDVIVGKTTADELLGREPVVAPEEDPAV